MHAVGTRQFKRGRGPLSKGRMKMKSSNFKKLSYLAALTSLSFSDAFAYENIILPFQTLRGAAMGNVRYTTGLYEENFFSNPARTADNPTWRLDLMNVSLELNSNVISNISEFSGSGDKLAAAADATGDNQHMRIQTLFPAIYLPRIFSSKNSFAFGIFTSTQADVGLRRNFALNPTSYIDAGVAFSLARRFNERLNAGITLRAMQRIATDGTFTTVDYIKGQSFSSFVDHGGEGTIIDFDLGMTHDIPWKPRGWQLESAFAVNNVLGGKPNQYAKIDTVKKATLDAPKTPRTVNFGVSGSKPFLIFSNFTGAFEITDIGNNSNGSLFRTIHAGAEASLADWVMVRAGINQGYLCAGVGIDLPVLDIELATYGEEMSLNVGGNEDRRYALNIKLSI